MSLRSKFRSLLRRYGHSTGGHCAGSGIGVRGLHETVRGQIQCPHCGRLLFPIENDNPPPYMVLPKHTKGAGR